MRNSCFQKQTCELGTATPAALQSLLSTPLSSHAALAFWFPLTLSDISMLPFNRSSYEGTVESVTVSRIITLVCCVLQCQGVRKKLPLCNLHRLPLQIIELTFSACFILDLSFKKQDTFIRAGWQMTRIIPVYVLVMFFLIKIFLHPNERFSVLHQIEFVICAYKNSVIILQ